MSSGLWLKELPAEIMVCDSTGLILAMNDHAGLLFADEGGKQLIGNNVLDCHPEPAFAKLQGMLADQSVNCYFNTENGKKLFFLSVAVVPGTSLFRLRRNIVCCSGKYSTFQKGVEHEQRKRLDQGIPRRNHRE